MTQSATELLSFYTDWYSAGHGTDSIRWCTPACHRRFPPPSASSQPGKWGSSPPQSTRVQGMRPDQHCRSYSYLRSVVPRGTLRSDLSYTFSTRSTPARGGRWTTSPGGGVWENPHKSNRHNSPGLGSKHRSYHQILFYAWSKGVGPRPPRAWIRDCARRSPRKEDGRGTVDVRLLPNRCLIT